MGLRRLLLLFSAQPLAAAASEGTCAAGSEHCRASSPGRDVAARLTDQDAAIHLLQQRGKSSIAAREKKTVNLALEGGGAASTTLFSGALAALMHVLAEEKGMDPSAATFASTGLFDAIPNMTTVSGGSWLAAGLIYSPYYLRTVEKIAQKPEDDAKIWNERWTVPLLGQPKGVTVKQMVEILETCILGAVLPPQIARLFLPALTAYVTQYVRGASQTIMEDLILFSYYYAAEANNDKDKASVQYTWQNYVDEILRRTAHIDSTMTLGGTPPNAFFKGKAWIPVVSQLNPARGDFNVDVYVKNLFWNKNKKFFTYQMQQSREQDVSCPFLAPALCKLMDVTMPNQAQMLFGPHYVTPAKFSITTGQGEGAAAPLNWCNTPSCTGRRVQYQAVSQWKPWWYQGSAVNIYTLSSEAPQTEGQVVSVAFEAAAGKLPISAVTAASSAAGGSFALVATGFPPSCGLSGAGVAASSAGGGKTFAEANEFMDRERNNVQSGETFTQEDFAEATRMALQLIVDGGLTDNTGAMTAIGEGAQKVFLMMVLNTSYVDMFMPDSGSTDFSAYHVFRQSQSEATANLMAGQAMKLPRDNFKHLQSIRYNKQMVTTMDNQDAQQFDIPPNKEILLEWLFLDSNVGLFEPLISGSSDPLTALTEEYNTAIAEVVETMLYPPNRSFMRELLKALGAH